MGQIVEKKRHFFMLDSLCSDYFWQACANNGRIFFWNSIRSNGNKYDLDRHDNFFYLVRLLIKPSACGEY